MQDYKTAGNAAYKAFMKQVSHHITINSKDSFQAVTTNLSDEFPQKLQHKQCQNELNYITDVSSLALPQYELFSEGST